MLKMLGIIGIVSLLGTAHAFDCNYQLLRMSTETEVGKILGHVPISTDDIRKDLDFLSVPFQNSPGSRPLKYENFDTLFAKGKALHPQDTVLQGFVDNCRAIYGTPSQEPIVKEGVNMLLDKVILGLEQHFQDLERTNNILRKSGHEVTRAADKRSPATALAEPIRPNPHGGLPAGGKTVIEPVK